MLFEEEALRALVLAEILNGEAERHNLTVRLNAMTGEAPPEEPDELQKKAVRIIQDILAETISSRLLADDQTKHLFEPRDVSDALDQAFLLLEQEALGEESDEEIDELVTLVKTFFISMLENIAAQFTSVPISEQYEKKWKTIQTLFDLTQELHMNAAELLANQPSRDEYIRRTSSREEADKDMEEAMDKLFSSRAIRELYIQPHLDMEEAAGCPLTKEEVAEMEQEMEELFAPKRAALRVIISEEFARIWGSP